jgi:NitT/TauT family transport system permease protein
LPETTTSNAASDDVRALIAAALPFGGLAEATQVALAASAEQVCYAAGETVYGAGERSDDLFVVACGAVRLERKGGAKGGEDIVSRGSAFGWTALAEGASRRNRAIAIGATVLLRLRGASIVELAANDPGPGRISREDMTAAIRAIQAPSAAREAPKAATASRLQMKLFQAGEWLRSPKPYLMLAGYAALFGFWHLAVEVLRLPRFAEMPGPTEVFREWLSHDPIYGVSIHTPVYYHHRLISLRRVGLAFVLATALGVPTGLLLGWSKTFRDYIFPLFEMLRPIPILAWVPLSIIMLPGSELPVLFLTFLASFFATALNTMLGVKSIDPSLALAAQSLGASRWQVFRHVITPGALPFIFTGLQISIGVSWFSLVAAEMVSGQFGLGYLINTSYTMVQYPTIVIAMITLGAVGAVTSAAVRLAGAWLMDWRGRQLAMGGAR